MSDEIRYLEISDFLVPRSSKFSQLLTGRMWDNFMLSHKYESFKAKSRIL